MFSSLANPNLPPDISLFNGAALAAKSANPDALNALACFAARQDILPFCFEIISNPQNSQALFYAFQIIRDSISINWLSFPDQLKETAKDSILNAIQTSIIRGCESYVTSMGNQALVKILRYDWPENWPNFIPQLIEPASENPAHCKNAFQILSYFIEDALNFNSDLSSTRISAISKALYSQFEPVFGLIAKVIQNPPDAATVKSTITAIRHFLPIININYITSTPLIPALCTQLLPQPEYTIEVFGILGEMASTGALCQDPAFTQQISSIFPVAIQNLISVISPQPSFNSMQPTDAAIIAQSLSNFFTAFQQWIETIDDGKLAQIIIQWMTLLLDCSHEEAFQISIDFWDVFTSRLLSVPSPLYAQFLGPASEILMIKIPAPLELIEEDEYMEVRKGVNPLYHSVKQSLCHLARLNPAGFQSLLQSAIQKYSSDRFNISLLNSLCWSMGAISGIFSEDFENDNVKLILGYVFHSMNSEGVSSEVAIELAKNFLFLSTCYDRFLVKEWEFMKLFLVIAVTNMHNENQEIQAHAVHAFKMTLQLTKNSLFIQQPGESRPFIFDLTENLFTIINQMSQHHIVTTFSALAQVFNDVPDPQAKAQLITIFIQFIETRWNEVYLTVVGADEQQDEMLVFVLHCFQTIPENLGAALTPVMQAHVGEFVTTYKNCNTEVKSAVVNLFKAYLTTVETDSEAANAMLSISVTNFLEDKVPEVLGLFGFLFWRAAKMMKENCFIPVMNALCWPTIALLAPDFESNPEIRSEMIPFMRGVVRCGIESLLQLPMENFVDFVNMIKWFCRHPNREICEGGFTLMAELFVRLPPQASELATQITLDAFAIIKDPALKFGFRTQAKAIQLYIRSELLNMTLLMQGLKEQTPDLSMEELSAFIQQMKAETQNLENFRKILMQYLVRSKQIQLGDFSREMKLIVHGKEKEQQEDNSLLDVFSSLSL